MMQVNMTFPDLINFFMIAAGIGVSVLSILQIGKAPIRKDVRKYFVTFLWMIILYLVMHLTRQMLEHQPGDGARIAIRTVTFIEFLASGFMSLMLITMILYTALSESGAKKPLKIVLGILGIHVLLLIVAQFNQMYYSFDAENVYHREKWYLLSNAAPLLMILQGIYLLIRHRDRFDKRIARAFWIYLLAPIAAMVFQAVFKDIQFVIFATVGGAIYMFAVITADLTRKFEEQRMESSRIETELSMATRIQADMLPSIFPAFPERAEFDIYALMAPAKEVGGDFYDFFLLDDDHLGIVMADVSGKGVPAALFMMASKILIQNYTIMTRDPKAALEAANRQICQSNHEEMFVTVWLGILQLSTGVLTASNAGHEYPALKRPGEPFALYKDHHGFVVGGMEGVSYRKYEIRLEKGSVLFVYTDGVAEATNTREEMFGTDRLLEALNSAKDDTPEEELRSVRDAVTGFVETAPQFDDLTMLCVRYNGPAARKGENEDE